MIINYLRFIARGLGLNTKQKFNGMRYLASIVLFIVSVAHPLASQEISVFPLQGHTGTIFTLSIDLSTATHLVLLGKEISFPDFEIINFKQDGHTYTWELLPLKIGAVLPQSLEATGLFTQDSVLLTLPSVNIISAFGSENKQKQGSVNFNYPFSFWSWLSIALAIITLLLAILFFLRQRYLSQKKTEVAAQEKTLEEQFALCQFNQNDPLHSFNVLYEMILKVLGNKYHINNIFSLSPVEISDYLRHKTTVPSQVIDVIEQSQKWYYSNSTLSIEFYLTFKNEIHNYLLRDHARL